MRSHHFCWPQQPSSLPQFFFLLVVVLQMCSACDELRLASEAATCDVECCGSAGCDCSAACAPSQLAAMLCANFTGFAGRCAHSGCMREALLTAGCETAPIHSTRFLAASEDLSHCEALMAAKRCTATQLEVGMQGIASLSCFASSSLACAATCYVQALQRLSDAGCAVPALVGTYCRLQLRAPFDLCHATSQPCYAAGGSSECTLRHVLRCIDAEVLMHGAMPPPPPAPPPEAASSGAMVGAVIALSVLLGVSLLLLAALGIFLLRHVRRGGARGGADAVVELTSDESRGETYADANTRCETPDDERPRRSHRGRRRGSGRSAGPSRGAIRPPTPTTPVEKPAVPPASPLQQRAHSLVKPPGSIDERTAAGEAQSDEKRRMRAVVRQIVGGEWQRGRLIGKGSSGSVYACILADGRFVALKQIDAKVLSVDEARQISEELRLMADLDSPYVIRYFHAALDEEAREINLWMEYVHGGSLGTLVRKLDDRLSESIVAVYTRQIVLGLKYLHERGVMHRDLKADNLLLEADGRVKLCDFGSAKQLLHQRGGASAASHGQGSMHSVSSSSRHRTDTIVGSPLWMAPEMVNPENEYTRGGGYSFKADIWGLGITICEMLNRGNTPWPPFSSAWAALYHIGNLAAPPELPPCSDPCRSFLRACLQIDPRKRPSASELLRHPWLSECDDFGTLESTDDISFSFEFTEAIRRLQGLAGADSRANGSHPAPAVFSETAPPSQIPTPVVTATPPPPPRRVSTSSPLVAPAPNGSAHGVGGGGGGPVALHQTNSAEPDLVNGINDLSTDPSSFQTASTTASGPFNSPIPGAPMGA